MKSEIDDEKTGSTEQPKCRCKETQKKTVTRGTGREHKQRIEDVNKTKGMKGVSENEKKMRSLIINSALRGLVHVVHVVLSSLWNIHVLWVPVWLGIIIRLLVCRIRHHTSHVKLAGFFHRLPVGVLVRRNRSLRRCRLIISIVRGC